MSQQDAIRIEIRHCLFGTTFTQAGEFREISEPVARTDEAVLAAGVN